MTNEELEQVASVSNLATVYFQTASLRLSNLRREQITISRQLGVDPSPLSETELGTFRFYLNHIEEICAPYIELPTIAIILEGMRNLYKEAEGLYREVEDLTKS